MLINRANMDTLFASYNAAFRTGLAAMQANSQYTQVAMTVPSSTAEEVYAWLGKIPGLKEWVGERVIENLRQHGYTLRNRDFEDTIEVDRNHIEDDRYGVYAPMFTALGEAAPVRQVIDSGRFESAQVYYNLINPTAARPLPAGWSGHDFSGLLDACRAQGVAVMNIRVFAAGVLATDVRHGREIVIARGSEMAAEEARARAVFDRLGDRYGTRAQTAIRFSLANPDVSCVVIGLAELAHLEEALDGAEMGPLPDEAVAQLSDLYDTEFGRL